MLTTIVAGLGVAAALAQPAEAEAEAPAATEAPAPVQRPVKVDAPAPPPATTTPAPARTTASAPAVSDAAWDALVGRNVEVQTSGGPFQGELLRSDGPQVVLVKPDGNVVTIPKANASSVRVVQPPPAAQPQEEIAALEAPTEPPPAEDEGEDEDEELTEGQKRRKERREKREHALLGAFTMHGATYSHWRGDGVNAGHASYAMDWGVGFNFSKNFGLYALAGGLFGAKIGGPNDDDGNATEIRANYGHVGGVFAFGGQWYYSTIGAGAAFSRLRFADGTLQRDKGLAIPSKLMARIPLGKGKMKKYYLGIGITYELAMVRNFNRYINAIGGQIVFGRW